MPIYDKSTAELLRDFVTERPHQDRFTSEEIHAWFKQHWPKIKPSTVQAHLSRMSTNSPSRVHLGARPSTDDLLFRLSPHEFRRYNSASDPVPIYPGAVLSPQMEEMEEGSAETAAGAMFAYESHLRDYLASNLHVLEPGLRLYQEEGIPGIEYPIRNRRIDLLAEAQDNTLVVIELKVSKGHDRTLGQILTYMGWVRQDLADGRPVRGIIIANRTSDELRTAAGEAKADIKLYEYEISFAVRSVAR